MVDWQVIPDYFESKCHMVDWQEFARNLQQVLHFQTCLLWRKNWDMKQTAYQGTKDLKHARKLKLTIIL
jgi:hypothetical protein